MDKPLLSIRNLSVSFRSETGWQRAVNQISFELPQGKILGIVGESGSGKSVTSLAVMKLLPGKHICSTEGEILFTESGGDTLDILAQGEKRMQKIRGSGISMIFQEPMTSLNPVMKCGKQLTEAIRLHLSFNRKRAREYTLELFREVLLPDPEKAFDSYPHQLSGGQKQRVMIALAIACRPRLMIADEPTTALDVTVQKAILTLLKSLQDKYNLSIIFISHDLGVISEIADVVLVMNKGEIVEQGNIWEIFTNPQHPYTRGLLACRPPLDKRPLRLPMVSDFLPGNEASGSGDPRIEVVSKEERTAHHQQLYQQVPLLKVSNLQVGYSSGNVFFRKKRLQYIAVDNVSLEVFKGETLGLVGESGCGKTTLGRAILRLIEPAGGEIHYNGISLRTLNPEQMRKMRKKIQIIFQDPYSSLNPRLTAGQAIVEPMMVHGLGGNRARRRQKAEELLERVSLKDSDFDRYPHQFSGGQRQRICIARALATEPDFIICDESVSALDVSVQAQVLNLLNDLKKNLGLTYIFISHDLSVVRFMSDRMLVMKGGKMVESGEADFVYANPADEYTRRLIASIPGTETKLKH